MKFLFLTCALCALILGVLASAIPNPDALANPEPLPNPVAVANPEAEAEPEAEPEALPATIEVSGGEIVARQESETPVAAPAPDEGVDVKKRAPLYCWKGWNKTWFFGNWVQYCCMSKCCYFVNFLANHNLHSAKATVSPIGRVRLWKSPQCTGIYKWVYFSGAGSQVLPGPGYKSMSL